MVLPVNSIIKRKDATDGGLIGGFFRFAAGGQVYGISCNHVIANINQCSVGDVLTSANNVPLGTLSHWLILENKKINKAEFALFKPDKDFTPVWIGNDAGFKPMGFAVASLNATVDFVSADGTRHGIITDLKHDVAITWNNHEYKFTCIEVQSRPGEQFSKAGHSGGAVYIGNALLGIILGVSTDGVKTYVMPYVKGILAIVNLKIQ